MFDLHYFKYLLKSKKYLLAFELLVVILISVTSGVALPRTLLLLFALAISYIAPFDVFGFIHDKKAVDAYFSLPVDRKRILFTGLIFCLIVTYIPFEIGIGINSILNNWSIESFVLSSLTILLAFACLIVFNALIYLVANNKLDGVIVTIAYTALPYAIYLVCICFVEVFVCGGFDIDYDYLFLVSPIYNVCLLFSRNIMDCGVSLNINDLRYIIASAVELAICVILLFNSFNRRKVEIAETVSKRFFAYPLVIALYCSLCMFGISSNFSFNFETIGEFLADNMLLYIILFIIFVAANFIYQRKFYFNGKMLAYFLIVFTLSLAFCFAARTTRGFGLSNKYLRNDPNVYYTLDFNTSDFDLEKNRNLYRSVYDWFIDKVDDDIGWCEIHIEAKKPTDKSTIDFFETKRISAIESFYGNSKDDYKRNQFSRLNVYNGSAWDEDTFTYDKQHFYANYDSITIDELLNLVKDSSVIITFYSNNTYRLNPNGELLLIEYIETVVK